MRISTQLRFSAVATLCALGIVVPVLYWAFFAFDRARTDSDLAELIHRNFFERVSFRDQYFLYREDRVRILWDESKVESDRLLRLARSQFRGEADQKAVERIGRAIEATALVFHRVVDNTQALKSASGNRVVFEELDKRLYSQMLLKATEVRNATKALQDSSARQVQQAYRRLSMVSGVLALVLASVIVLNAVQIGGLVRRRLAMLHDGANRVSDGNLAYRIESVGSDEFSEIADTINGMMQKLQLMNQDLEAKVRDRTAQLQQSESRLRAIIEAEPECIRIVDAQGRLIEMNPAGLAMFEADSLEQVIGRDAEGLIGANHREAFAAMHRRVLNGESVQLEYEVVGLRGGRRWLETHAAPLLDHGGIVRLAIDRDITGRKQAEAALQLAASVFSHAREGIMITDPDGTIVDVNDAFTRITGYGHHEVVGQNPRILGSGRHDTVFYAAMWSELITNGHWSGELWNRRKSGEMYATMQTVSSIREKDGRTLRYLSLFSDITMLKEHQNELEHIAHFDALTNLPNRVLLADRLQQAMVQCQRRGRRLAVAYLDLDGFKTVNDRHGHEAGDSLLIGAANAMKQALREGDTLARIGGDEFVAVLPDLDDVETSAPLLVRLLAAAATPVQMGELLLQVSASIGVSFYPQLQDIAADQLLRQADHAMYQAKLGGKNLYHVFDTAHDSSIRVHHDSVVRIREALTRREFVLYYQPKVNMRTGKVIGTEALIRWQHPDKGLLAPEAFLPVIEDHPLAVAVGEWVLETALAQVERWRASGLDIAVSVNVGARQLQQPDFCDRLRAILGTHPQVDPCRLELEILETSALEDINQVSHVIESCIQLGVTFALDDFGTGYSSLSYLKRLRVSLLKIDKSFVRDMLQNPDDLAILRGVIGLAAAFGRQVIAEGVESVAHGTKLLQMGCHLAQGFGIARPMPAQDLPHWAARWQPDAAWLDLPAARSYS